MHPRAGGAEVYTLEVAKRLVGLGDEVTWFSSSFPGSAPNEDMEGIQITRAGTILSVFREARKFMRDQIDRFPPDVVIDEVNTRPFNPRTYLPRGIPVCNLVHQLAREVWFYETPLPIALLGRYVLENRWLKSIRNLPTLAMSESTSRDLLELGFTSVSLPRTGLSSHPPLNLQAKTSPPLIVMICRLSKGKRPRDALDAFRILRDKIACELVVIGTGPLEARLRKKYSEVTFAGHTDDATREAILAKATLMLAPGTREGWGRVVLEAQAHGTVPIVYDIPGLRDAVDFGRAGILAKSNSALGLADATLEILRDSRLLSSFQKACYNWSTLFDWDSTTRSFRRFLEDVRTGWKDAVPT